MTARGAMGRNWATVLDKARLIVGEYDYPITLRQLHYRLVMASDVDYENTQNDYKYLSERTARGRRDGTFPALLDETREVVHQPVWTSPAHLLRSASSWYRLDRTAGQDVFLVLGGEKMTLRAQLENWFGHLGVPLVLLRGYGSQSYIDDISEMVENDGRPAVLAYCGVMPTSALCRTQGVVVARGGDRANQVGIIKDPPRSGAEGRARDNAPASSWAGRRARWLAPPLADLRVGRRRRWLRCPRARG